MGIVSVDTREWKKFREDLKQLSDAQVPVFMAEETRKMGLNLLELVIPRTPVGRYTNVTYQKKIGGYKTSVTSIRQGGNLRRGWDASKQAVNNVNMVAGAYQVNVENATPYASYVEYGHRQTPGRFVPAIGKRLKKSWVEGKFFLRASEQDLERAAPSILQKDLDVFLGRVF